MITWVSALLQSIWEKCNSNLGSSMTQVYCDALEMASPLWHYPVTWYPNKLLFCLAWYLLAWKLIKAGDLSSAEKMFLSNTDLPLVCSCFACVHMCTSIYVCVCILHTNTKTQLGGVLVCLQFFYWFLVDLIVVLGASEFSSFLMLEVSWAFSRWSLTI